MRLFGTLRVWPSFHPSDSSASSASVDSCRLPVPSLSSLVYWRRNFSLLLAHLREHATEQQSCLFMFCGFFTAGNYTCHNYHPSLASHNRSGRVRHCERCKSPESDCQHCTQLTWNHLIESRLQLDSGCWKILETNEGFARAARQKL